MAADRADIPTAASRGAVVIKLPERGRTETYLTQGAKAVISLCVWALLL
jgi:hypothetical protein